ncbi:MAG: hypothetical protein WA347_08270 [Rhabdochlamydiaceae bacterium]|jgi:hypothetical protein
MSNNIPVHSSINSGIGNNWNIPEDCLENIDSEFTPFADDADENYSSGSDDSSSIDASRDDLSYVLKLAEFENSLPFTHMFNDENSYSTSEWIEPSEEAYRGIHPDKMKNGALKLLNGKLIQHSIPDNATERLRENLKTAKKIIRFVQDAVPFSSNYLQRSKIFSPDVEDSGSPRSIYWTVARTLGVLREEIYGPTVNTLERTVRKIVSFKTGNCHELCMTGLLFSYAKNQQSLSCAEMFDGGFDEVQQQAPVEMFEIPEPQGDHIFLVIGRNQRCLPSNYRLWGPDAVVCDVWSGAHYPASKIDQHLLDYVTGTRVDLIPRPLVRNFDPSRQKLTVMKISSIQ